MEQIKYNSDANALKFEFPTEWDVKTITDITITVLNSAGTELLTATSLTLWTQTTLDSAAARFADEITLDSAADDLIIGDLILIEGIEGDEVRRVKGYDTTNQVVQLESILDNAHDEDEKVWGLFGTYTLDTTTIADYPKGQICTFLLTPDNGDSPFTVFRQVAASSLELTGLRGEFMDGYPRYYDLLTNPVDRLARVQQQAERHVYNWCLSEGLDIQRLVGQTVILDAVMTRMAYLALNSGDVQTDDERKFLSAEYESQLGIILKLPLWTDDNQDNIEGDGETSTHIPTFSGKTW